MNLSVVLAYVIASFILQGSFGLKLNRIDVPSVLLIENDDTAPIKLDCIYDVEDKPNGFVVKWKKDDQLIYQWIYGKNPTVIHPFGADVKEYESSTEPFQQFRGIELINPTIETTGVYKCIVISYKGPEIDEKSMAQELQVVHTSNHSFNLDHHRIGNETHVDCTIQNVYPKPELNLASDDGDIVQIITSKVAKDSNGFFNATTIAVIGDDDADPDSYTCTASFRGLPYNLTITAESGSSSFILHSALWLLCSVLLRIR